MKTRTVQSVEDPNDEHPWYEIDIEDDQPAILADKDGSTDFDMTGVPHSVPDFVDLPAPARAAMTEDVTYAVTTDGEFIAYEEGTTLSNHGIELRAHLAWYDSDANEFEVLDFVER